jgi:hypothetical protein
MKYRHVKKMEFIVLSTFGTSRFHMKDKYKAHLSTMAIETDGRGVSRRIDLGNSPLDPEEWVKYRPRWRTIFLV